MPALLALVRGHDPEQVEPALLARLHDQLVECATKGVPSMMNARPWSTRKKDQAPRGVFRHPSGVWAIRFTCGAGHIHKEKAGPAKTGATNAYHDRRARARREPGWCPAVEREQTRAQEQQQVTAAITVREYAERWLRTQVALACRERTVEIYTGVLARDVFPALGDLPLTAISRQHLLELFAAKGKGRAHHGLRTILIPLRAMLNAAVDDGLIPANPALRIGRLLRGLGTREAQRVTALTSQEIGRLLARADLDLPDYTDLVHTLAWAGLRTGEACGLQWADVDSAEGFFDVKRTVSWARGRVSTRAPKSGKPRRVDIPTALLERLEARRTLAEAEAVIAGRQASPWIFPDPGDQAQPLDNRFFTIKRWPRLLRAAGLRYVKPHALRHTYATQLLQAGTPVLYVKDQLGHASIAITVDIYGHAIPNANRAAVEHLANVTAHPVELAPTLVNTR
jgi:integrase